VKFIQFLGQYSSIFIIGFVVIFGIMEKKNVFEIFTRGVQDGEKLIINLFPTWLGLFFAIGLLKSSGIIDIFVEKIYIILKNFIIYKEIIPLIFLRPISGSASTAMGIEIMKSYGVDTNIGKIASCIMGASETTIYVVAIYSAKLKNKNLKPVLVIGLIADLLCVAFSILALKLGLI